MNCICWWVGANWFKTHRAETNCACCCVWTRASVWEKKMTLIRGHCQATEMGSVSQWGQPLIELICDSPHKELNQSHPSAPHAHKITPSNPRESPDSPEVPQTPAAEHCTPRARTSRHACLTLYTAINFCSHLTYGLLIKPGNIFIQLAHVSGTTQAHSC